MRKSEFSCDCGCKKKASSPKGWFVISQAKTRSDNDEVKLRRTLHFYSLDCILRWSGKAAKVAPELVAAAGMNTKRGEFRDRKTFIYV